MQISSRPRLPQTKNAIRFLLGADKEEGRKSQSSQDQTSINLEGFDTHMSISLPQKRHIQISNKRSCYFSL
jgi:hypothetical protein